MCKIQKKRKEKYKKRFLKKMDPIAISRRMGKGDGKRAGGPVYLDMDHGTTI